MLYTAQKMKFSITHLLKKSLMENFFFGAVIFLNSVEIFWVGIGLGESSAGRSFLGQNLLGRKGNHRKEFTDGIISINSLTTLLALYPV